MKKKVSMNIKLLILVVALLTALCVVRAKATTASTSSSYVQKCCPRKKQLNGNFEQCIDYEGLHPFEKYDSNVTWWIEAGVNVVKMGDEDQHIWWIPPGTRIYSPAVTADKTDAAGDGRSSSTGASKPIIYKENVTDLTFAYGNGAPPCKTSDREIVPFKDDVYLLDNGQLLLTGFKDNLRPNTLMFPSSDYCIDRVALINPADRQNNNAYIRDHTFVILTCPCQHMPCIRMCCPPKHYLKDGTPVSCEYRAAIPKEWSNLTLADDEDAAKTRRSGNHFSIVHGIQDCEHGYYFLSRNNSSSAYKNFKILQNGDIQVEKSISYIPSGSYCLHYGKINGTYRHNLLVCHRSGEEAGKLTFRNTFYGCLFVVGSCFLAVTLLVYGVVPELRSSLHSKILMAHTGSLLLAYVTLSVIQLQSHHLPKYICNGSAYVVHFSFIAAFFWLNVMCVDIAWTFSGYKISNSYITRDRDRQFLILYALYAWGFSFLISSITALADFGNVFGLRYKPKFGNRLCWFNDSLTLAVYFYLPIGVILFVNILLFSYTTSRILKMQNDSVEVSRGDSVKHVGNTARSNKDKSRLILYAKLFALMGVTWIFEILSWAIGGQAYYWYITDAINSLRGVFVFFIFCWKRRVLFYICNRLPDSIRKRILNYFSMREEASSSTAAVELSNSKHRFQHRSEDFDE